jgi:Lipid A core - O-antigen ligase and related enzymes
MNTRLGIRGIHIEKWIILAVLLSCLTPRFLTLMKVNVGFNMSYYSIVVILIFCLSTSFSKVHIKKGINRIFLPILLIIVLFDILRTNDITGWTQYFFYILICNFMMVLLCKYKSKEMYDSIARVLSVAVAIHILIGVYEVTVHSYLFEVGGFSSRLFGKVAVSIFYNPNDYSMFIATMFPFVVYSAVRTVKKSSKFIYIGLSVLCVLMLLVTSSRAAILGLIASLITLGALIFKKNKYKLPLIFIVFILLFSYLVVPGINSFINQTITNSSIDTATTSDIIRINLLRNGIYFLKQTHWLGVGAGNLKLWLENKSIYNIAQILYMHNWYMEIFVTFGVVVFILYIIFHVNIFISLIKKINNKDEEFVRAIAFFSSFVIFSITSISSSSNIYSEWFWMYIAMCISYIDFVSIKNKNICNSNEFYIIREEL